MKSIFIFLLVISISAEAQKMTITKPALIYPVGHISDYAYKEMAERERWHPWDNERNNYDTSADGMRIIHVPFTKPPYDYIIDINADTVKLVIPFNDKAQDERKIFILDSAHAVKFFNPPFRSDYGNVAVGNTRGYYLLGDSCQKFKDSLAYCNNQVMGLGFSISKQTDPKKIDSVKRRLRFFEARVAKLQEKIKKCNGQ